MGEQASRRFEFGPFRLDAVERSLWRAGEPVPLTSKLFDILFVLVENNGHVVEKERLMHEVWPATFVEEGNLTQNISVLRKLLKDERHQFIQTVPRRGYRFVGQVHELLDHDDELVIESQTRSHVIVDEHETDPSEFSTVAVKTSTTHPGISIGLRSHRVLALGILPIAAITIVATYFVLTKLTNHTANTPNANVPRSIAVLPFQTLNANADEEFLGLGMTDALISRLSNIKQANVRPTSAVQKYSARQPDAIAAGKELRVDSVLQGNVQKEGDRIRVSVQFIDVHEGKVVWAHSFDEKFTDIFAVEDEISAQIGQAMAPQLSEDERTRLAKHYTNDPAAYELYLQGRFYLDKFTEDGTKLARKYFEQAISEDPRYALAYSGLAESYAFGEIGLPPAEAFPRARESASKAIELDETVGQAHAALAQVEFLWDWDWAAAEKEFKRAIELTPADPEIHHMYAHYLTAMGRFDEALAESQRLLELDPLSPASRNHLGWHYLYAHQFDQAIEQYKLVLALDPNFAEAHRQLAEVYGEKGRFDDAVTETVKRLDLIGRANEVPALQRAYAKLGWKGFWQERLALLQNRSKYSYMSPSGTASIYAALKDTSPALDWLERAYREHDHDLVYMKVDHTWDVLRSESRFKELLKRMRLDD